LKQKEAWRIPTPGITAGGTITTHGGLVFQPDPAGHFAAFDASSGKRLWSFDMGVGSQAAPITYSVNGRQYVSVLSGFAGQPMMLGSVSAQHGWVGRNHPRRLLTFALDGRAKLPPSLPPSQPVPVQDADFKLDPAKVAKGGQTFLNCVLCHGLGAVAGGFAPDLRASPIPVSAEEFAAIVKHGALESRGMPTFGELSSEDLEDLRQYIRSRAIGRAVQSRLAQEPTLARSQERRERGLEGSQSAESAKFG
jgi:quinohemoprotein ethanol dehydrogenase